MAEVTWRDLPILTDRAREKIVSVVSKNPGLYSPASLVGAMERREFGGIGRIVTYRGAGGYRHLDATGAVALWNALDQGLITLDNDWKLWPRDSV